MAFKIDGLMSPPLLGGARIANAPPQSFDQPIRPDLVIENPADLENVDKDASENEDDFKDIKKTVYNFKPAVKVQIARGFVGLSNLGNTCFMNCVLQALANVEELRDYFLTERFRNDVNRGNPLGTGGSLAEKFFVTLKHLWSPSSGSYSPYDLKEVVSKHASQFEGYMQHDAQEFLAFFMDLLHEDVNRIVEKPLFETPNLDSYPDEAIANKLWELHKSRNDSFIVDLFHGMLKSKLTCPQCQRQSTTFDPFVFLSVPIPRGKMRMDVTFCGEKSYPTSFQLLVSASDTVLHLLHETSNKFGVPLNSLRLYNITSSNICEELPMTSSLSYCRYATLFVLEKELMSGDNDTRTVVILQRKKPEDACKNCAKTPEKHDVVIKKCMKCKKVGYCSRACQGSDWPKHKADCNEKFDGVPFIIQVPDLSPLDILLGKLDKWLNFTDDIACEDDMRTVNLFSLYKKRAFNLYKYCSGDVKERILPKQETLDLSKAEKIVIEWTVDVTVCSKIKKTCATSSGPSIIDCLRLFTEPEILAAEEAWHCPQCKKSRKATKELSLWKLPEVLVIQLKRFSLQNRLWRQKIDDLVDFPIEGLDLRPFCVNDQDNGSVYDLFAVANHHGSLHMGHYTSYVRLSGGSDPGWRYCDDNSVTPVRSLDQLVTKSSYMLFYRRRNMASTIPTPLKNENSVDENFCTSVGNNLSPVPVLNGGIIGNPADVPSPSYTMIHEHKLEHVPCCSKQYDPSVFHAGDDNTLPYTDMDAVD